MYTIVCSECLSGDLEVCSTGNCNTGSVGRAVLNSVTYSAEQCYVLCRAVLSCSGQCCRAVGSVGRCSSSCLVKASARALQLLCSRSNFAAAGAAVRKCLLLMFAESLMPGWRLHWTQAWAGLGLTRLNTAQSLPFI